MSVKGFHGISSREIKQQQLLPQDGFSLQTVILDKTKSGEVEKEKSTKGIVDALVKSLQTVIPAKAGIQNLSKSLDSVSSTE